ncbi:MAG: type VII secretion protein EssC [Promicromonosporaceae bacterium]|nr:type VII secretion protein EssC [Promicromonosporaceae bacterium]
MLADLEASDLDRVVEIPTGDSGLPVEVVPGCWVLGISQVGQDWSTQGVDGPLRVGWSADDHLVPPGSSGLEAVTVAAIEEYVLHVLHEGVPIYLNGVLVAVGTHELHPGDAIWVDRSIGITISDARYVTVTGTGYESRLAVALQAPVRPVEYPVFKRPPREVYRAPDDAVDIKAPPEPEKPAKGALLKLIIPPLLTSGMTVAMALLMGRGMMMLMGLGMTVVTLCMSIWNYVTGRRDAKAEAAATNAEYESYLLAKRKELWQLRQAQIKAATYHYLTPEQIERQLELYSPRVFERAINDADFLTVSLGTANRPVSYKVKTPDLTGLPMQDKAGQVTLAGEVAAVVSGHLSVPDLPVVVDLKAAHLGLVGEPGHVRGLLAALLLDLGFFQSYHDIEIIVLTDEPGRAELSWARWLPHCRVKSINITGLVSGENHRDQVLGNLSQLLKQRDLKQSESKQDAGFLPHYVFVVDSPSLVVNHSVMEFLQRPTTGLGFSLVWVTQMQSNLPENIKTVLRLEGSTRATLVMNEGELNGQPLTLPSLEGVKTELTARRLAPIKHVAGVSTQIPEAVTFFELYKVEHPHEIPIADLWAKSASHKSLAVPLGLRGKDDVVDLNLHERAHGPHGLVAGTTGSGKSEIVQSYILSLAAYFHPHEVGFLLIDYKGGGMANLFDNLPHLLGTITNLDGAGSMRALASIKAELARRQRIFNEVGVNNINSYTKAFKAGEVTLPLPHLFLISDEFAELKKEQPEFMAELVSTARIGRSLGVHLILATQKPSGVVDDQIWSNSRFRLALKVANEGDSNEVLKTPDAARITQPGRAILQVGNNEIYEMFQSAWSGAPYVAEQVDAGIDRRVYMLNELGQGTLVNQDLSATDGEADAKATELDVMVNHIRDVYDSQGCIDVEKPWLPPLADTIVSPAIDASQDVGMLTEHNLTVPLGIADIPEQQAQAEFSHTFDTDGNLAVFGASGMGKSVTLTTIALTLATRNSPALCQMFVLDYGNSGLAALRGLPHTGDYLAFGEAEKLAKLIELITGEMDRRKQLFAAAGAHHFAMYNQAAKENNTEPLAAMFVIIDNYDVVPEAGQEMEQFLVRLTRDGASAGMFVMLAASRPNVLKYSISANFKRKLTHFLTDATDTTLVVGRTSLKLDETPGRALVRLENPQLAQCYLPAEHDGNDLAYARRLQAIVETIATTNTATQAAGVKVLADTIPYEDLTTLFNPDRREGWIGYDIDTTNPIALDLTIPYQIITGGAATGKTNLLRLLAAGFQATPQRLFISDSRNGDLAHHAKVEGVTYLGSGAGLTGFIEKLEAVISERLEHRETSGMTMREFLAATPPVLLLIDDLESLGAYIEESITEAHKDLAGPALSSAARAANEKYIDVFKRAAGAGICLIATAPARIMSNTPGPALLFTKPEAAILLGAPQASAAIITIAPPKNYKPTTNQALWHKRGTTKQIKIPRHPNTPDEN